MDRAEKLIRDAKPADQPLSARAEADLAKILATPEDSNLPQLRPSPRRLRWVWAAAAALVVAVVIAGVNLVRPGRALAATPPMPAITATGGDAGSTLRELEARAAAQPDRSSQAQIITQWWALASEVDANGVITSSTVQPTRRVATLGRHGIVRYTDYAAQPVDSEGRPVDDSTAPAPGTVLETTDVDPDQQVFVKVPPEAAAKFGSYLDDALEPSSASPSVDAFSSIRALLSERILTPTQNAALLGYLASLSDIQLLGASTDRLGRAVLVFAAPTEKDNQTLLMLSPDTGQITATEVIYRGADRTDIPTPAVVEYVAWENV